MACKTTISPARTVRNGVVGNGWTDFRDGIHGQGIFARWQVRCVGDTLEIRLADADAGALCAINMQADYSNMVKLSPRRDPPVAK